MKLKHLISSARMKSAAIVAAGLLAGGISATAQSKYDATQQAEAAKGVIERFIGEGSGLTVNVAIDLSKDSSGKDKFSYNYNGGTLTVHASSGVAACRGFYDFVKSNGAGISSWSGKRFKMPTTVEHATKEFTSPYRDHQYLNVVTYGYSMPYWDEDRWMKELDWMALHGIDMPLMLLASESIYRDVFAAKGLSQSQIDEWEVGPAHLPWFRMGNLAGNSFDGPLGQNWHNRQKALAKAVLKRMGELGMKPVVPAFGGFVPKAYAEKLGSGNYVASGWGWMPQAYRNYRITPARSEFKEIGKNFIERWDAEFEDSYGTFQYYLSDSFNEMDVPSDLDLLASYGNQIYNAIKEGSGNNDAVWVTQGWEFVYGRSKWNASKYQALRRDVPAHHFMSLYMAPEYGGYQWNYYNNFYGDDWNYTMLPNMGGKNFWTGNLNDYAKSYPQALANGGAYSNCTGWGMTMEGIEYNELLYELISDMGWTNPTQGPDVQAWMEQYGANRYGSDVYDDEFKALHTALRNTVYSSYKDHQNFGWQGNNKSDGYYNAGNIDKTNDTFYAGFDRFFSNDNIAALRAKVQNGAALGETLRADLLEFAAFYAAARVEKICARIKVYNNMGKKDEANALIAELQNVMYDMDYALTGHPLYDEAKWEAKAEKMAETDPTETNHYVKNARRIVTTWYGEHGWHEAVNDYASRIYAGIIRDYYMPRLVAELNNLVNGQNNNLRQVELNFIPNKSGAAQVNALSVPKHVVDGKLVEVPGGMTLQNTPDDVLLDFVAKLVTDSRESGTLQVAKEQIVPSTDSKTQWYVISSNYDNYRDRVITVSGNTSEKSATYTMQTVSGSKNQYWRFISTGDNTYRIESREGHVLSYDGGFKTYKYNINSDTQWDYNADEVIYAFKPATASNWLHYANANKGFELYKYTDNGTWLPGSTFTLETVNLSDDIVAESDYARYRSRLEGYNTWFPGEYGQVGLPKTAAALTTTISGFNKANNAGALTSITNFLEENWPIALKAAVDVPEEGTKARVLFDLMLGALDLPEGPDASAVTTFRAALHSAQAAIAGGNESTCATQYTALQSAVKAYMNTVPNFPYASKAPQGGKFVEGSKVITLKVGNGGYITTDAVDSDKAFKLTNSTKPTTSAGYWVVSGDDANGYTFYNVGQGATKVLGITNSEANARAKMYDANAVPSGVDYKFFYRTNNNGAAVFYNGTNNTWNKRGDYLARWASNDAFATDLGSAFTCEVVANADLGDTAAGGGDEQNGYAKGTTATITAVFPDGTKHVVYSDGEKLTAGETVPETGISTFDVAGGDKSTGAIVLMAGDKYLHLACGDDASGKQKMNDPDGLSETENDWTTLTLEKANASGVSLDKRSGSTTVTGKWDAPSADLYQIKGVCSDNQSHYFILRSDDNWIGANSNDRFFDSNWNGDGTLRTSFFEVTINEPEVEAPSAFPLNFSYDKASTSTRAINAVKITPEDGEEQSFSVSAEKIYSNRTVGDDAIIFTCSPGQTIKASVGYSGNWMNAYFYIDDDDNGLLTYPNSLTDTGTELKSYSFWSVDLASENSGWNSEGTAITGGARNTLDMPKFTAPREVGEYKVRFKIDWNCVDPAGRYGAAYTGNFIDANGGYIVDAILRVQGTTVGVESLQNEQNTFPIFDLQGRRVDAPSQGVYIMGTKRRLIK